MAIYKLGLILNFIGSILLASHMAGMGRLKRWEKNIKNLPQIIASKIFEPFIGFILLMALQLLSKQIKLRKNVSPSDIEQMFKEFSFNSSEDIILFFKKPFSKPIASFLALSFLFLSILTTVFSIAISPFVIIFGTLFLIQERSNIESFLGLLGAFLLIIGFVLQFIAT